MQHLHFDHGFLRKCGLDSVRVVELVLKFFSVRDKSRYSIGALGMQECMRALRLAAGTKCNHTIRRMRPSDALLFRRDQSAALTNCQLITIPLGQ
jgi:hypothetical protein